MAKSKFSKNAGFTIVELLIVVVVIAILATITIVTYNGMQNRAYAAKLGVVARHYKQTLLLYKQEYGRYPYTVTQVAQSGTNVYGACLGKSDSYAHIEGGRPMCRWGQTKFYVDDAFNEQLAVYSPTSPDISSPVGDINLGPVSQGGLDDYSTGMMFMVHTQTTLDGELHPYWLSYFVPLTEGCVTADVAVYEAGSTWPNLVSGSGAKQTTSRADGITSCLIPLPL